jgi:CRISPR/Cas system Type II protein with McrA/HNH and RuvC-like nuclease domain
MKRKSISKKLRFEIFKRDQFTCQYCGSHPPSVILHIDHIIPVKSNGDNSIDNLITSCSSCNLGKSANSLNDIPQSLKDKAAIIKESESQLKEYAKVMQEKKDRIYGETWRIAASLENKDYVKEYNSHELKTIEQFIGKIGFFEVQDAAELSFNKFPYTTHNKFRYFCGICWNKIKENNHG